MIIRILFPATPEGVEQIGVAHIDPASISAAPLRLA